jgi:hypothetical protein
VRLGYRLCFAMKLTTLILTISMTSLCAARAEDANMRSLQPAQPTPAKSSSGACTPIGLTANGDIVFPWECRETIERQRGPIAVSLPTPSSDAPVRETAAGVRREEAVATVATVQPKVDDTAARPASPPEANETATPAKPHSPVKRASDAARPKPGQKVQQVALRLNQGSKPAADPKKDKVAAQSVVKPK